METNDTYVPEYYKKYRSEQSRFIEVTVIADVSLSDAFNNNEKDVLLRARELVDYAETFFSPLNIRLKLADHYIALELNASHITPSPADTLDRFAKFVNAKYSEEPPFDIAILLTNVQLTSNGTDVNSISLEGEMCTDRSIAIVVDHREEVHLLVDDLVHEMGHSMGMKDDLERADCPAQNCIMMPEKQRNAGSFWPFGIMKKQLYWSERSLKDMSAWTAEGNDRCLMNDPFPKDALSSGGNAFAHSVIFLFACVIVSLIGAAFWHKRRRGTYIPDGLSQQFRTFRARASQIAGVNTEYAPGQNILNPSSTEWGDADMISYSSTRSAVSRQNNGMPANPFADSAPVASKPAITPSSPFAGRRGKPGRGGWDV